MNEETKNAPEDKNDGGKEGPTRSGEDKKDVNVVIEMSKDKLEVYLTLTPLVESPTFSNDEIRTALAENGIKFGIKEEVFALLDKEMKYDERILIASGTKLTEGKDGTIKYFLEETKPVKVRKNEKIAEIIPPEAGVKGTDVFGENIAFEEPIKFQIPKLTNVEFSPENEDILIATMDGYLTMEESFIQVAPFFVLEKVVDEYEAYIKVNKRLNEKDFKSDDLKLFIKDNEIVYGILEEEIENIFKQEKFDQPVLLAKGERPVDGKDSEIKYYFETEIKPQVDENGNVDYKELSLIQNVKKGDKLAEICPPEDGTEGCTIFGKKVPHKKGLKSPLPSGENTQHDPNNPNILLSEIDGCVKLKGNNIVVDPVFIVNEDVDFSSGNIDFCGSVVVNGNVRSGFKIKAKCDVEVNGVLEDALIEAGGNVLLKLGFIGKEKGKIIAGGEVNVLFCENETIMSEGDINIGDFVMNSRIQTKGRLYATEKTGLVLGGETLAVKGVEAKVIGNDSYIPTKVCAGVDREINDKMEDIREYLPELEEELKTIEEKLQKIENLKRKRGVLPRDQESQLDKLKKLKKIKEEDKGEFTSQLEKYNSEAEEFKNAVVKVYDIVHPRTTITIYDRHIKVQEPMRNLCYKYTKSGLIAVDLKESEKGESEKNVSPSN